MKVFVVLETESGKCIGEWVTTLDRVKENKENLDKMFGKKGYIEQPKKKNQPS